MAKNLDNVIQHFKLKTSLLTTIRGDTRRQGLTKAGASGSLVPAPPPDLPSQGYPLVISRNFVKRTPNCKNWTHLENLNKISLN